MNAENKPAEEVEIVYAPGTNFSADHKAPEFARLAGLAHRISEKELQALSKAIGPIENKVLRMVRSNTSTACRNTVGYCPSY
jgi:hypothetical protein